MYMEIVKETMENQHKIIVSYEGITKKLEAQINECQGAMDDSTKRETEQLQLIMSLKEQYDKLGKKEGEEGEEDDEDDCDLCEAYEDENSLLREQCDAQAVVIKKLSQAQEMLMMQYKVMEVGLNQELEAIQKTQEEIENMKNEVAQAAAAEPAPPQ